MLFEPLLRVNKTMFSLETFPVIMFVMGRFHQYALVQSANKSLETIFSRRIRQAAVRSLCSSSGMIEESIIKVRTLSRIVVDSPKGQLDLYCSV